MKTKLLTIVLLAFAGMAWGQVKDTPIEKGVAVETILNEIVDVLNKVETQTGLPQPKNVSISFETAVSKGGEFNLEILIFKIGGSKQNTLTNKTTFNFGFKKSSGESLVPLLSEKLKKTIESAYKQLSKIKNENISTKKFTVEVSFMIEKSGSAEGKFVLVPVTLSAKGSLKKKAVHTIRVDFE